MAATKNGTADAVAQVLADSGNTVAQDATDHAVVLQSIASLPTDMRSPVINFSADGMDDDVDTTSPFIWVEDNFTPDARGNSARRAFNLATRLPSSNDRSPMGYLTFVTHDGAVIGPVAFRPLARAHKGLNSNKFEMSLRLAAVEGDTIVTRDVTIRAHQIRCIRRRVRNPHYIVESAFGFDVMADGDDDDE